MFSIKIEDKEMQTQLAKLKAKSPKALEKALIVGGLSLLRWSADGSPNSDSKPPISTGFLRGSGSAFVGNKYIGMVEGYDNSLANRSHNEESTTITLGFNAEYATDMHENYPANPKNAPHSMNDPGSGGKWLENHIAKDKEDLMKVITHTFGKELGTL